MTLKTQQQIADTCDAIKQLLLDKNKKYGDSAMSPIRIFSKSTSVEQILVRIDDKLSRISRGAGLVGSDEDVIMDLIGYLVLLKIAIKKEEAVPWDGSDISDFGQYRESKKETSGKTNDKELVNMYRSGDKFA